MPRQSTKKRKTVADSPATKNEGWVQWVDCSGRQILLDDLEEGRLSLDDSVTAEQAWETYRTTPEFANVVFTQFKARLKDHRKQVLKKVTQKQTEWTAYLRDVDLHPRQSTNGRGEPVFDLSSAKDLLRQDVKDKVHEEMSPWELWQSRPEYMHFKLKKFRHRIYQEVRLQKYYHYRDMARITKKQEQKQKTLKANVPC
jgi:hypothetical protein